MSDTATTYLRFFWAGLVKQAQTGAIVPSQRFLIAKMIAPVPVTYRGRIIELGAGTGALTLKLAARCPKARILACEINPVLAEDSRSRLAASRLSGRVEGVVDSAQNVLSKMIERGGEKADFVISGIPLGPLGRREAVSLIDVISRSLGDNGTYIQFQYSLLDRSKIRAKFPKMRTVPALLNFPPAVVYIATR